MANEPKAHSSHQGTIKDPENDGRLKENREAGHTKGTTPGSEARAHEHGREPAESSHSRSGGSHSQGSSHSSESRSSHSSGGSSQVSGGSREADDLKAREYKDAQGNIHHHTRTSSEYQKEQKK